MRTHFFLAVEPKATKSLVRGLFLCFAVAALPAAWGQAWEVGGAVGGGFYTSQDLTSPTGTASASIRPNLAASFWAGGFSRRKLGGELRYDYQMGDLHLSGGGTSASFSARTQAVHYDLLWSFFGHDSRVQPFVAAGAGVKIYQGTGTQVVYQPLSNVALLTQAQDLTPLVSAGGGIKFKIAPHVNFRVEVHDYLTPFPKQVITPITGKTPGWLEDFVPMAGLAYVF